MSKANPTEPKHCTGKDSHSQEETALFWGDSSSSQIPDISLTPFEGPYPCHRVIPLVLKHQLEHSNFTLKTAMWNRNQPRHPPVQQARGSRGATQTTVIRTAKNLPQQLILTHKSPTTHWGLLHFTSFLTFHLWLRNNHISNFICITHYAKNILSEQPFFFSFFGLKV